MSHNTEVLIHKNTYQVLIHKNTYQVLYSLQNDNVYLDMNLVANLLHKSGCKGKIGAEA